MSLPNIFAALEKKLALMASMPTAYENMAFTPVPGVAYQRVNHILNKPIDHAITADVTELRGILQVMLCYPTGTGRGAVMARAQSVADHFAPVQELVNGGIKTVISKTAKVSQAMIDGDRYCVPVSIEWQAFT